MKLRALLFPLTLAVMMLTAGAKAPVTAVTLEVKEKQESINLTLGQELKLVLPTTTLGYVWEIAANDIRYLKQSGKVAVLPGGPTSGATIAFVTNRPGRTRLSFVYVKPGDSREVTPLDKRDILVMIK